MNEHFLRLVKVVIDGNLDRELLSPYGGIGQVNLYEEWLENNQCVLSHTQSGIPGNGNGMQHPGCNRIRYGNRYGYFAVGIHYYFFPQPGFGEELAHPLYLG